MVHMQEIMKYVKDKDFVVRWFEWPDANIIVMEYMENGSLSEYLRCVCLTLHPENHY
jgi:hypothetical protein